MKLKKPAKDHRGEWDLVLDNDGTTVAALKHVPKVWHDSVRSTDTHIDLLWPVPYMVEMVWEWKTHWLHYRPAIEFFANLGVDTAPLEKLMEEKNATGL